MTRRMLLGLKQRAETLQGASIGTRWRCLSTTRVVSVREGYGRP